MAKPDDKQLGDLLSDVPMMCEEHGLALACGSDGLIVRPMTDEAADAIVRARLDVDADWDGE